MRSLNNLSLKEKFLIIAHHPSKGRFMVSEIILNHGIIGALLLELSNKELIYLKNKKLGVKSRKTKDELLASMLARINNSPKERSLKSWVSRLSNKSKKYKWGILNTLSDKAILKINKRKFLGLIPYKLTYFTNNKIREDLIENINNLVFKNKKLNNEDIALLSLIDACKMHKIFCKTSD
ncbi:MAG: hypothetical protein C0598_09175 [Marinilabiliales bacterium]|nr:MAG: hypothetical protein C0598_09175 [Marinilabiliales bacterium]